MTAVFYNKDYDITLKCDLLSWDVCHGMGESCDYFEVSFVFEKDKLNKLAASVYFRGFDGSRNVFYGLVDEYTVTCDESGSTVTVSGRSLAARLFDNEAEAASYARLSLDTLVSDHVTPCGILRVEKKSLPTQYGFSVSSGESEWSVLSRFCRYAGGFQPRFSPEGVLLLYDRQGETRKINDSSRVFLIKRRDIRYGLISSVTVKNRVTGARYTVHNTELENRGGLCKRVITVPKTTGADAVRYTADYQLRESKRGKNTIELGIATQFAGFAGDFAEVNLPEAGIIGRYRVIKSRCYANASGGGTYLTLEV